MHKHSIHTRDVITSVVSFTSRRPPNAAAIIQQRYERRRLAAADDSPASTAHGARAACRRHWRHQSGLAGVMLDECNRTPTSFCGSRHRSADLATGRYINAGVDRVPSNTYAQLFRFSYLSFVANMNRLLYAMLTFCVVLGCSVAKEKKGRENFVDNNDDDGPSLCLCLIKTD